MNALLMKSSAAILVSGLLLTGCENLSPAANGVLFGVGAGALSGGIAKAAGASNSQAVAIGLAAGAVAGAAAYIIRKNKATPPPHRNVLQHDLPDYLSAAPPPPTHLP